MYKIQLAFKEAMISIAKELGLPFDEMNLLIQFDEKGMPTIIARKGKMNLKKIQIIELLKLKMISARMSIKKLVHFFLLVKAFYRVKEKVKKKMSISLVLYPSKVNNEICIGIYADEVATIAFRLSEVASLLKIGKAELN